MICFYDTFPGIIGPEPAGDRLSVIFFRFLAVI